MMIAVFFTDKDSRDKSYTAVLPLLTGKDHGVSGPTSDFKADWQLWATCNTVDLNKLKAALTGTYKLAVNGVIV